MNNNSSHKTTGNDFDLRPAPASGGQMQCAESLDLFAEELPEHCDLLQYSTISTTSTASCAGGTAGTIGTYGCLF